MHNEKASFIGVDLFAGAGGMSLGAQLSGIDVKYAIEIDSNAANTYAFNHPVTKLTIDNIKNVPVFKINRKNKEVILFGGPPCQGFSTSNQKTRSIGNSINWLYKEFVRFVRGLRPDWIVFENVRGIIETEKGFFLNCILQEFRELGYTCTYRLLCASDFGIPQDRFRFFLIGSLNGEGIDIPTKIDCTRVSVRDAVFDLPELENGANTDELPYQFPAKNDYVISLRGGLVACTGHLVSKNSALVVSRYSHIPQGGNWEDIPEELMGNYTDRMRCHTGVYRRLKADSPAVTIGNYRKAMLVHPWLNRGLSVREAARLQSFPDCYQFKGSIGFQQQQVGNAVPPLLAKQVFSLITEREKKK